MTAVALAACTSDETSGTRAHSRSPRPGRSEPAEASTTPAPGGSESPNAVSGGGPVPGGFRPVSITAISSDEFWMLGTAPCESPPCTSIVATTTGGTDFFGLPAPVAPLAAERSGRKGVTDLRFASESDGYAFGPDLFVTHDAANSWQRGSLKGNVRALGAAGGRVYAVVADSGHERLWSSPIANEQWAPLELPGGASPSEDSLTVHGAELWVVGGGPSRQRRLFYSQDHGNSFESLRNPCEAHLGASFSFAGGSTLWAVCVTGMQADLLRSTNGGETFSPVPHPPLSNSAFLGASTPATAFVGSACGPLLRVSAEGDKSKRVVRGRCGRVSSNWSFVGFTDPAHGYAIRLAYSNHVLHSELWRTTDGGDDWARLSFDGD